LRRFSWTCLAARLATAAVLLVAADVARATPVALSTPGGLNPGDKFRFIFVTSGTTQALSGDIAYYNSFVNTEAGGATYDSAIVTWKAVGSTSTVDARDNVGGYNSLVPIYLVNGTRVANDLTENSGGFWSNQLLPGSQLNMYIGGTTIGALRKPWTGSHDDGTKHEDYHLGTNYSTPNVLIGNTTLDNNFIWDTSGNKTFSRLMWGISSELMVSGTPVPEIDPAGMGSVLALVTGALGLLERRRRQTP